MIPGRLLLYRERCALNILIDAVFEDSVFGKYNETATDFLQRNHDLDHHSNYRHGVPIACQWISSN
jgi:hypothetical protein